jgi:hypothetical protein
MKSGVRYVLGALLVAAALAPITIVSASGEATQQRSSSTHSMSASLWTPTAATTPPGSIGSRWENSQQDEMKLRYFVESQEGEAAVAALLYTGYRVQPELLGPELSGLEGLPTPVTPR